MRESKPIWLLVACAALFVVAVAAAGEERHCELPREGPVGDGEYRYVLSKEATALYPQKPAQGTRQASVFPYYYEQFYTDLGATVAHFTELSLQRGGAGTRAEASIVCDQAVITLEGSGDLEGFAAVHKKFMAAGAAALDGAYACYESDQPPAGDGCTLQHKRCWDPNPCGQPWSFMLPLGLPMLNQHAVLLLNYPPSDALCGRDYLNNFTMARFASVLASVGVAEKDTALYETILDSRPIAAPGSGQASCMPDIDSFFRKPPDKDYVGEMMGVLVGGAEGGETKPLFVLGGPAQETWQQIIGKDIETGQGGVAEIELGSHQASVPWVAANHPDVTSYNCCAGDMSEHCQAAYGGEKSTYLVQDELKDLVTYCAIQKVGEGSDPQTALDGCAETWCQDTYPEGCPAATKREICVRLRLDYNYNSENSQCKCRPAAEAFCEKYDNDGCPNGGAQTSCEEFNKSCPDSKQPWVDCPKS